jgi:hypothetical protein
MVRKIFWMRPAKSVGAAATYMEAFAASLLPSEGPTGGKSAEVSSQKKYRVSFFGAGAQAQGTASRSSSLERMLSDISLLDVEAKLS